MSNTSKYYLKKIQEAKDKQLKKLDLSGNYSHRLNGIPVEVFELEQLEILDLSNNQLTTLPEAITRLTNLTRLYLSNNQLTTLPEAITRLTNLTGLDLSNNQLTTLPEAITRLTNLTELDLSDNQLTTLPEAITKLTNLTELDLIFNQLKTLPEAIARLTNLTELYLSYNQLTTLPEAIARLTNLTGLYLSNNQLTTLPEAITRLTNLTGLYLSNNQLTTLPEAITRLTNLTGLYLSNNQLTTLPEAITRLTNLTELYLRNNQLITLPEAITRLTNLTGLYLSNNQLTTLPEAITRLTNLTELDLRNNQLTTLPEAITRLTNLTGLYLSNNQLTTLPEAITRLTNLTGLYLSNNQLTTLPEAITRLTNLTGLYLSNNQLTTLPEAITRLTNLTELYLRNNQLITLPEAITRLTNLTGLDLRNNQLTTLPEAITRLTNLTELDLSYNQLTTLPEAITRLTNLTELDLRNNQLTTLPEAITRLTNLTKLDLRNNQLTTLPEAITKLTNLTKLDLSYNQLTTLPEAITKLTNLTGLYLRNNQLTTLPEAITRLTNLTELHLSNNQLTTLPEAITRLTNLTELHLSNNQLTTLPEAITRLTNLTELYLSNDQLTTLPEAITKLTNLTELDLSYNQLTTLPEAITRLTNLTELDLRNNQLTTLPEAITRLTNLTKLHLRNNPIETPPLEIVKKGIEAIRDYFRQSEKGTAYLYEAKLLIVGEAGAGKTSLAKKIENSGYQLQDDQESTKGIEVIQWDFPLADNHKFRVNIWDFGGQEIYHATHQFFLTKRSLYTLVADTRKEDTDFYYWLNVVELLSENSPLLIIKNEKQDRHREINERALRGRFTNLQKTLATNLATNRGLPEILTAIKHHISNLPHVGTGLPITWTQVREALEKDHRNYISLQEYLSLCQKNGFTQHKYKLQLSGYLHDLGVCLHFQDDSLLNKTVILKPEWGTAAVYKVLDNSTVIRNLGRFNRANLEEIWQEEQYALMQDELLQLMINFKLCYKIPGTVDTYIAPQLLTENQPEYNWNQTDNLILRYAYQFMPKGIITQFIVVMHKWIDQQKYVWKSGIILQKDKTKAEVIEDYDKREIKIRIAGIHKRDLMTIVTHELDKIHNSYKRLKYNKLIPCNCHKCKPSQNPYFYSFERLRQFIADRQEEIQCQQSYAMVNVRSLLDDVIDRKQSSAIEREPNIDKIPPSSVTIEGDVDKLVIQNSVQRNNNNMTKKPNPETPSKPEEVPVKLSWAWRNGSFYLFVFVIVFTLVGLFSGVLPIYSLLIAIIAGAIFIVLIGVMQLREDERLSEKSFVKLVKIVIEQLPLIGNLLRQFISKK